jgi:UDP-N-acetylmuramoyl-L-alanyl-D-glutamate--2,6-diaminopimelate ligase
MSVTITALFAGLTILSPEMDREVTGVTIDSRKAQAGDLFLACQGERSHGLDYLSDLIEAGVRMVAWEPSGRYLDQRSLSSHALPDDLLLFPVNQLSDHLSLIADRFYQHPSQEMSVIGITGTDGKTSVSHFLAQALERLTDGDCGLIGTLGSGRRNALVQSGYTTPDAVQVQALLAEMRDQQISNVAMEVSSHALDQGRVSNVQFSAAVLTNLSSDHLDYHGTLEAYRQAKAKLFHHHAPALAVLNLDDQFGAKLIESVAPETTLITYGFNREAKVCGYHFERREQGFSFSVMTPWGSGEVNAKLLGDFNASNLLAVMAILLGLGYPFERVISSLEEISPVPGRMECFKVPNSPMVVVDFAHTPNALGQMLKALRPYSKQGKLWSVFGCGGDRDRTKRPEMGSIAYQWSDHLVLTSDNPRSEDPEAILAEIKAGIPNDESVKLEVDRERAIAYALSQAKPEDVVVVAGKGHETEQILADRTIPFDDREVVKKIQEALS